MAKQIDYCPDCAMQLVDPDECRLCGWVREGKKPTGRRRPPAEPTGYHLGWCAYHAGDRQCPLPGAYSHNHQERNAKRHPGPWYCWLHIDSKNRLPSGETADEAMDWIEANRDRLIAERYPRRPIPGTDASTRPSEDSPLARQANEPLEVYHDRLWRIANAMTTRGAA